jgi:hypothetical protein
MRICWPLVWLYSLSSCLFLNGLAAQSLIVSVSNLPASGERIRLLCELKGALVYQSQFDYAPGTLTLNKTIQLSPAMGYLLRASATKGLGRLPLIVASGKTDKFDVAVGVQDATVALSPPQGALVRGAAVLGATTVYFRYDDAGGLLRAGSVATMWCSGKSLKRNASGRQIIAPMKVGPDGRLVAAFLVPTSDRISYCQAGYYSEQQTPTDQIPIFVYPDLTSGLSPISIEASSAAAQGSSSTSNAEARSLNGPQQQNAPTISTVGPGKDGHLERKSSAGQQ